MDVLWEVLGFAGKALIVFITFTACAIVIFARARQARGGQSSGHIKVERLDERMRHRVEGMRGVLMDPKSAKQHAKWLRKQGPVVRSRAVFVLDFKGDILASAAEDLREEVTALIQVCRESDEVMVRLESPGGAANSYGFAASQLARFKARGVKLTVCVDKVAASGGYMMAAVADEIVAAPFAIVGSIGVAAPLPNAHRLLERIGIDYENVTAGEYKRTVSPLAKITDEGRQKFQEQIDDVHKLFKDFVKEHRPDLDIDRVATGEHWHGVQAKELGLVNRLMTSDDFLMEKLADAAIFEVSYERNLSVRERLVSGMTWLFSGLQAGAGMRHPVSLQ